MKLRFYQKKFHKNRLTFCMTKQKKKIRQQSILCCFAFPPKYIELFHIHLNFFFYIGYITSSTFHCILGSLQTFSAVCWLYGKFLSQHFNYPIGLVETNWGGTRIEAWSSPDALKRCAGFSGRKR